MSIAWPEHYVDPQTGTAHSWDDAVPRADDEYDDGCHDRPYTYRDLIGDQAEARGMDVEEYLDHLAFRRGEDVDDEWSPGFVDDGDGYGL